MNQEYPAHGPWRFTINRLVGCESEAVSDVTVTDGARTDRAITFFTVATASGTLQFQWTDDNGQVETASAKIAVE